MVNWLVDNVRFIDCLIFSIIVDTMLIGFVSDSLSIAYLINASICVVRATYVWEEMNE